MMTTMERPQTVRLGLEIAVAVSFAAVPGTSIRGSSARPTASGTPPTPGTTSSVSGWGGRLRLESLPLYLLGSGGEAPWSKFCVPGMALMLEVEVLCGP
jgi:hypothetical protein